MEGHQTGEWFITGQGKSRKNEREVEQRSVWEIEEFVFMLREHVKRGRKVKGTTRRMRKTCCACKWMEYQKT